MRYSNLFGKTTKTIPKDIKLDSHKLLVQAGFIKESTAGRYYMLPLGMLVQNKVVEIVRQEMSQAGAQEMITPVLHPLELWKETNRTNEAGFELMRISDRRGAEFALGGTAEEMFVDVVRKYPISYKDLPFNLYQFSSKFRDELRARGGLLRVREFLMKDAYSFNLGEEDFKVEYQKMWDTYMKIFERMGLRTVPVLADNGYIGGEYSHEFIVESEVGESRFLESEDGIYRAHEDVALFGLEPVNPDEEEKPMEIIEQPQWVKTIEDVQKHYGVEANRTLKNVVYRNFQGDVIIATIRGDLEVNPVKLEKVLGETVPLAPATEEDFAAIDSKPGYIHAWGHQFVIPRQATTEARDCRVIYVADRSLKTVKNMIGGQKEDTTDSINVNYGRDFTHEHEGDIALAKDGFLTEDKSQRLVAKKGIEVGNIFQLGYHYTHLMSGATYTDKDGAQKPYYMGCYGIGVGRAIQTVVEVHHDERGIIWPESIAPFTVYLIELNSKPAGDEVYSKLQQAGVEVLYDNRSDVSPGQKFTDADLIGIPVRLVVSPRTEGKIEWKKRSEKEAVLLTFEEVIAQLKG